ncbi:MAG: phosphoesterase [Sphingobium sp.]|nr:phosphoesterase [Sphingobium sp.]
MSRRYFSAVMALGLLGSALPAQAEKFTVAVVPDTQNYSDASLPQPRGADTYARQIQYIVDQQAARNIVFTSFVGDIVQHGDGQFRKKAPGGAEGHYQYWDTRAEWDVANRAVSILSRSSIPFGMVPGNHDYDNYSWWSGENSPGAGRPLSGGRVWNLYFGPESRHFAGKKWYGGSFNQGLNSYQYFTGGGKKFLHLSLEMDPNQKALDWAQTVIDANPGLPVIVTTHEWLSPAPVAQKDKRPSGYDAYFKGADNLSPDEIWDRFIRKNTGIFMILSGHHWTSTENGVSQGENLRIDKNDAGYPVYQILQDYQGNTIGADGTPGSDNGGAGWTRFMEFDTDSKKIKFTTYSPVLNRYAGKNGEKTFGIDPKLSDFELPFPPQIMK